MTLNQISKTVVKKDDKLLIITYDNDFKIDEINNVYGIDGISTKDFKNNEIKVINVYSKDKNISGIYNLKGQKLSSYHASCGTNQKMLTNISYHYENGYIIYENEQKFGLMDLNGTIVVEAKYDELIENYNNDTQYIALLNGKYGIIDNTGKTLINFDNDEIVNYNMLVKNDKFALIDENSKLITDYEIEYSPAWKYSYFLCCLNFPPIYDSYYENYHMISFYKDSEGYPVVMDDGYTYAINKDGQIKKLDGLVGRYSRFGQKTPILKKLYSVKESKDKILIDLYNKDLNIINTIKHLKIGSTIITNIDGKNENILKIDDKNKTKRTITCYSLDSGEEVTCPEEKQEEKEEEKDGLVLISQDYKIYKEKDKYIAYYKDEKVIESKQQIIDINDNYIIIKSKVTGNYKLYKFIY